MTKIKPEIWRRQCLATESIIRGQKAKGEHGRARGKAREAGERIAVEEPI